MNFCHITCKNKKQQVNVQPVTEKVLRGQDLNLRPSGYEPASEGFPF